ncbi:MAG: S8 family serine peptidase, partial [Pirellulaceae bacterium]|nr:S8 family serine peptidase [Pirellulaceae bacterium]
MRCSYFKADALRVCSRLSLEIAGFPNLQQRAAAAATPHGPQCRRRSLRIEPLETRQLLDAAGGVSSISSLWFENVSDQAAIAHAGAADWTIQSEDGSAQSIAAAAAQPDVYDWIVQFDTSSFGEISSVAETCSLLVGGGVEFEIIRGLGMVGQVLVRSSNAPIEEVAAWLSENAAIASFEQDAISQMDVSTPTDPLYNRLWGMAMIDAPEAWSLSTGSSNVVVAVIDTGVDYNHVDLAANLWVNPGEIADNEIDNDRNGFVDDLFGYNFLGNNGNSMDDNGHGTHVAGTIAAAANNSLGVAGVNWSSSIMSLKFLDGNGVGYLSDAVRAINYATLMRTQYDVNVRVI